MIKHKVVKYNGTIIINGGHYFLNPFEVTNFDSRDAQKGSVYLSVRSHKRRILVRGIIEPRGEFVYDELGNSEFKETEYVFFPHNDNHREKLEKMSRERVPYGWQHV